MRRMIILILSWYMLDTVGMGTCKKNLWCLSYRLDNCSLPDITVFNSWIVNVYGIKFVVFELFILFLFYYHEIERGVDKTRGNKKCKERYDMFKKVFWNVYNFVR